MAYQEPEEWLHCTPVLGSTSNIDSPHQINNQLEKMRNISGRSYSHAQTAESQSEPDSPDIPPHNQNHPESSLSICRRRGEERRLHNQNVVYVLEDSSRHSNTLETFTDKLRDGKPIIHLPLFGVLQFPSLNKPDFKMWLNWFYQAEIEIRDIGHILGNEMDKSSPLDPSLGFLPAIKWYPAVFISIR